MQRLNVLLVIYFSASSQSESSPSPSSLAFGVSAWSFAPSITRVSNKYNHGLQRHTCSRHSLHKQHLGSSLDEIRKCSVKKSSCSHLMLSSPSSYEEWGDGNLMLETFTDLYSADTNDTGNTDSRPHIPLWLLQRAANLGYTHPTLMQQRALDMLLPKTIATDKNEGDNPEELQDPDVILHAQTGSGKTLAYLLPVFSRIDVQRSAVQALIVVPTRELGLQVVKVARRLAIGVNVVDGDDTDDDEGENNGLAEGSTTKTESATTTNTNSKQKIMVMPLLEGSSNKRQRAWAWAEPPHIIIGTPEELTQMVTRGGVRVNSVKMVVVDEVDACLGNGGSTGSGTLHELLSRHLNPTYQEVERLATNVEGADGRTMRMSVSSTSSDVSIDNNNLLSSSSNVFNTYADKHRQTIFASATIPQHNHFMKQCVRNGWTLREPVRINVSPGELVPPTLKHVYVVCRDKSNKVAGLRRWMKKEVGSLNNGNEGGSKILIFCDPRRPLDTLAEILTKDFNGVVWREGYTSTQEDEKDTVISVLRLEDSLGARAAAMEGFRGPSASGIGSSRSFNQSEENSNSQKDNKLRILLSTDLAARGLDIPDITHVINFDLPSGKNGGDIYVHRGGRAGRLGSKGKVMSLITSDQEFVLERLANMLSLDLSCVARQEEKKGGKKKERV